MEKNSSRGYASVCVILYYNTQRDLDIISCAISASHIQLRDCKRWCRFPFVELVRRHVSNSAIDVYQVIRLEKCIDYVGF